MDMNGTYNQQYSGIVLDCSQNDDFVAGQKGWSNVDLPGLVNVYTAIEHGPVEIVDLPSYKMVFFSIIYPFKMVNLSIVNYEKWWFPIV